MAAEAGQVELYVTYQGPYTWIDYEVSAIDFNRENCEGIFTARVNRRLPPSEDPRRLALEMEGRISSVIRLPTGLAQTLHQISIRLFQFSDREFQQESQAKELPLKVPPVVFEENQQYEIKLLNEPDDFSISIARSGEMAVALLKPSRAECVKEFYEAGKWPELFAFLDEQLPALVADHQENAQHGLYLMVCDFALRDYHHDLLIYTFIRMAPGPIKEAEKERYAEWLQEEKMVLPPSQPKNSYEKLAAELQQSGRAVVFGLRTRQEVVADALRSIEDKREVRDLYLENYRLITHPKYVKSEVYRKEVSAISKHVFETIERGLTAAYEPLIAAASQKEGNCLIS